MPMWPRCMKWTDSEEIGGDEASTVGLRWIVD